MHEIGSLLIDTRKIRKYNERPEKEDENWDSQTTKKQHNSEITTFVPHLKIYSITK